MQIKSACRKHIHPNRFYPLQTKQQIELNQEVPVRKG